MARDDEVEVGDLLLGEAREEDELAFDASDADARDGGLEGDVGDGEGASGGVERDDVGGALGVHREGHRDDLDVVAEALGEEGPEGAGP